MRNYIRTFYGTVVYEFIGNPGVDITQHFIAASHDAVLSQMDDFKSTLDPSFFTIHQTNDSGHVYWLLNQDFIVEMITDMTSWWSFIGSDHVTTESPRKTWSHGE